MDDDSGVDSPGLEGVVPLSIYAPRGARGAEDAISIESEEESLLCLPSCLPGDYSEKLESTGYFVDK